MQQSMTGYGQSKCICQQFLIKVEVKTLNSKFLDFSSRYPKVLNSKEVEIRNLVTDTLQRGKVILTIELETIGDEFPGVLVNEVLFKAYYEKFRSLSNVMGSGDDGLVKLAIQAPEVIQPYGFSDVELPWDDVKATIMKAANECVVFRKNEGTALMKKFAEYISNIESGLRVIETASENRDHRIKARLQKGFDEIRNKIQLDENRFHQELIFYLERMDIAEEKVRLAHHLCYFNEVINKEEGSGKKLGFIVQEIGREINTIGSKANDAEIQHTVVMMKNELEKIKEQVFNLL